MSILEEIGKPQSILPISNKFIKDVLQKHVEVIPSGPVFGPVTIPGSKSISNRVLLLAALGKGTCVIKGLLDSDDTQVMLNALERFGASFEWAEGQVLRVTGTGGKFVKCGGEVYLNNAGTASRFLTSTAAFIPSSESSPLILTGNARMKERPIGPLVEALRANGCCIEYMETPGCLPLRVKHTGLQGGMLALQGKVSSQYVSSVLMSAPYARSPMTLHLAEDHPTSLPYITMTLELMKDFGVAVEVEGENRFRIPVGAYTNPTHWTVEPDASSATYFLAMAAMSGGEVKVTNLGSRSLQGDSGFYRVLELMGCAVEQTEEFTRVRRDHSKVLVAFTLNMENMTDAFMTAAVLAAVAEGMSSITGISNQRVKECNRILVMVTELSKLGIPCGELEDGIWVQGVPDTIGKGPSPSVDISCHDDHRIAMSFAVLGSVVPGINITDKECTGKTFPGFWDDCRLQLRIPLNSSRNGLPSICLIGMRACGKSTLGRIAASALGLGFLNMDDVLVRELNMPIETFVLVHGWEAFREAESNLLRNLLKTSKPGTILSCGGGIVELESNVKLLTELNPVVNVQRDFKTVAKFLAEDRSRPNLPDPIDEVWVRREPLYRKCSDYTFTVDGDWETVNFKFIQFVEALLKN
jgi:pentafunctional AROM polypeptide